MPSSEAWIGASDEPARFSGKRVRPGISRPPKTLEISSVRGSRRQRVQIADVGIGAHPVNPMVIVRGPKTEPGERCR
jgi:hypothetical protein